MCKQVGTSGVQQLCWNSWPTAVQHMKTRCGRNDNEETFFLTPFDMRGKVIDMCGLYWHDSCHGLTFQKNEHVCSFFFFLSQRQKQLGQTCDERRGPSCWQLPKSPNQLSAAWDNFGPTPDKLGWATLHAIQVCTWSIIKTSLRYHKTEEMHNYTEWSLDVAKWSSHVIACHRNPTVSICPFSLSSPWTTHSHQPHRAIWSGKGPWLSGLKPASVCSENQKADQVTGKRYVQGGLWKLFFCLQTWEMRFPLF